MFVTVHTAAGLVIGKYVDSSVLAFIFGFLSHLLLDALPHDPVEFKKWPEKENVKFFIITVFIEFPLITAMLSVLFLTGYLAWSWPVFWAIIGAVAMDFLWGFYKLFPKFKLFYIFQELNHFSHVFFTGNYYLPWYKWLPIQLGCLSVLLAIYLWL